MCHSKGKVHVIIFGGTIWRNISKCSNPTAYRWFRFCSDINIFSLDVLKLTIRTVEAIWSSTIHFWYGISRCGKLFIEHCYRHLKHSLCLIWLNKYLFGLVRFNFSVGKRTNRHNSVTYLTSNICESLAFCASCLGLVNFHVSENVLKKMKKKILISWSRFSPRICGYSEKLNNQNGTESGQRFENVSSGWKHFEPRKFLSPNHRLFVCLSCLPKWISPTIMS